MQFRLVVSRQFDQAGVHVKVDDGSWIEAGVELSDGEGSLGAVVMRGTSDWSLSPVPDWAGRLVTERGSRSGNALPVRARVDEEPWRPVRVAPLDPEATFTAGSFCCAPTRADHPLHFTSWRATSPTAACTKTPDQALTGGLSPAA